MATTKFENKADLWRSRYDIAVNNQEKMFRRFATWFDLFYAAINTKNYAPWRSKVYLPIIANKGWAMVAKILGLNPGFKVSLKSEYQQEPEAATEADKAQWKLESDWDNPELEELMEDKLFAPLIDSLVTGTGFAKVPWVYEKSEFKYRQSYEDGTVDLENEVVRTNKQGHNDLIPVNVFNVFIAPSATSLYASPWVIIKEFKTYSDLVSSGLYDKSALLKVKNVQSNSDQFADLKRSRNRLTGDVDPITSDDTIQQLEVYECYDKATNSICTYVAGGKDGNKEKNWLLIREMKNPYWHGKYPIVAFYIRRRPYDVWGQGIFEDTESMQSAIQTLLNHLIDQYGLSINGMIMQQEGDNSTYTVKPGGTLKYRNNPPQQFKFSDPNPNIFQVIGQMIESEIEQSTISSYESGTPDSATDKTAGTASGIKQLRAAAGEKLGFFKKNYRNTLRHVGRMWLSNNRQFTSQPDVVNGVVDGVPQAVQVSPAELQKPMVLKIDEASMEPLGDDEKLQKTLTYQDRILALSQASVAQHQATGGQTPLLLANFTYLGQQLSQDFGENDFEKVVIPSDQVQMPQPQQEQKPPKTPAETINYKDAPPDIQRQIEEQAGLQPSQVGELQPQQAQIMQKQGDSKLQMVNQRAQHELQLGQQEIQSDQTERQHEVSLLQRVGDFMKIEKGDKKKEGVNNERS